MVWVKRWARGLAAAMVLTAVSACGGGVYLDYEYVDDGGGSAIDAPPAVSIATSSDVARAGDVVRLVVAASDDYRVSRVDFYSVASSGEGSLITSVYAPPYQVDAVMPATPEGIIYFMARATDDVGQTRDSRIVSVSIVP
jgi:hypothetical protein